MTFFSEYLAESNFCRYSWLIFTCTGPNLFCSNISSTSAVTTNIPWVNITECGIWLLMFLFSKWKVAFHFSNIPWRQRQEGGAVPLGNSERQLITNVNSLDLMTLKPKQPRHGYTQSWKVIRARQVSGKSMSFKVHLDSLNAWESDSQRSEKVNHTSLCICHGH